MHKLLTRNLGLVEYQATLQKMQSFTATRTDDTSDEIWICQHPKVFTQGRHGKAEHILDAHNIPVIQTDRGGQVTYHGPGQVLIYLLLDIKRLGTGIRKLVSSLENTVVEFLNIYKVSAHTKKDAPGVHVDNKKISSIGLRVKRHYCYHGLSFNIDMDLTPFSYINPCGYKDLKMTQLKDFNDNCSFDNVSKQLLNEILICLNYGRLECTT